ncbi:hypothetical protein O987_24025 [Comamonas testosteroni TK102]|uniref:Uncharacterized protein n=1 Tax=Comamonas testosteroni TK102 TaxID=1392005 RepID=A0A076PZG3_COMTE|nr:hypothetical protein [Comamonas testosteroni]AIJ48882.1 hypothetical protein O987_24025 [Comamonas testosteroni TK102]
MVTKLVADGLMCSFSSIVSLRTYMNMLPHCKEAEFSKNDPIGANPIDNPEAYLAIPGMADLSATRDAVRFRVMQVSEGFSVVRHFAKEQPEPDQILKVKLGVTEHKYNLNDHQHAQVHLNYLAGFGLDVDKLAKLRNELAHDTTYAAYAFLWNDVMRDSGLIQQTANAMERIFMHEKLCEAYKAAQPSFKKPTGTLLPPVTEADVLKTAIERRAKAAAAFASKK